MLKREEKVDASATASTSETKDKDGATGSSASKATVGLTDTATKESKGDDVVTKPELHQKPANPLATEEQTTSPLVTQTVVTSGAPSKVLQSQPQQKEKEPRFPAKSTSQVSALLPTKKQSSKIPGVRLGSFHAIYKQWRTKQTLNPDTKQYPSFRIAIRLGPKTRIPNQTEEQIQQAEQIEKEKWGALVDAINKFAEEVRKLDMEENLIKRDSKDSKVRELSTQPIEITVISAYGQLAAIQKNAEETAVGKPISSSEALDTSIAEGEDWERGFFWSLFSESTLFLDQKHYKDYYKSLGLQITWQIKRWTKIESDIEFANDFSRVKEWYKTDPSFTAAVNEVRDEYVRRTLFRLKIVEPIEPKAVEQTSSEYQAYLKAKEDYVAKKQRLEEASVHYILREATPLTKGLVDSRIPVILYPGDSLDTPAPAALTVAFEKYKKEGFLPSNSEWNWCSYTTGPIPLPKKPSENPVTQEFCAKQIKPVEFCYDIAKPTSGAKLLQRKSQPMPQSSPVPNPLSRQTLFFQTGAPSTSSLERSRYQPTELELILLRIEKEIIALKARMDNVEDKQKSLEKLFSLIHTHHMDIFRQVSQEFDQILQRLPPPPSQSATAETTTDQHQQSMAPQ